MMMNYGNAVVYCENSFLTTYGKTAHGLVRFTERYAVRSVIDSRVPGEPDARVVLDGRPGGIPIVESLSRAIELADASGYQLTHFIIGVATDGGYLTADIREAVREALESGLNIDSGLHDYVSDDDELRLLAERQGVLIRDIRKSAASGNHMFTGKIHEVSSRRIPVLGTDSALGKRTTAWILVHALREAGRSAEMIGTGQTAWLQGARYCTVMDSLINDYVSGELEHAVWSAWHEQDMEYAIIEGQGSLMNPGYPGGFEILAACRPHGIIMQHAPMRREYDGFPGFPLDSLKDQIFLAEFLSRKPVIGITVNHEGMDPSNISRICGELEDLHGIPACDPLITGIAPVIDAVLQIEA
jgi:uncharacterized NAD-dependent epimerase/dehydratase family protein